MKKIFLTPLVFLFIAGNVTGQKMENWQNRSFESDGVYGAGVNKARELAKGKTPVKTITVALIGYGIDVNHKSIKDVIWVNPKEKLNGKDDDKNGWIDDIHGWNFLGNADTTLNIISREGEREYLRLKDKYDHYLFVINHKAYQYDTITQAVIEAPMPGDMEEYNYFRKVVAESELAEAYRAIAMGNTVVWYINEIDKKLEQKFPDRKPTKEDFTAFFSREMDAAGALEASLFGLVNLMFMSAGTDDWEKMKEYANTKFVPYQRQQYERMLARRFPRDRGIIGDDVFNLKDRNYGNNNLRADNSGFGSMIASIIGARRDDPQIEGITENVKIMTLRVDADIYGEPYVKDIALAIRYAVDKGADIIQLCKTNTLYPRPHSQWVDDALLYAERKGALVVIPMMDYSRNLDNEPFYPNRHIKGGTLTNIITVAASDSLGNPRTSTNFSQTELDLFAPGVDIKSAYIDDRYAIVSGSVFAAAMVTGVAAFIKSYYPKIHPAQMRKLLMDTITLREDAEVEKQYHMYTNGQRGRLVTDLFLFSELCASGGILNAEKAFIEAGKLK